MSGGLGCNLQRDDSSQDQAVSPCVRAAGLETPTASPVFQAAHHLTLTSRFGILALIMTFQN